MNTLPLPNMTDKETCEFIVANYTKSVQWFMDTLDVSHETFSKYYATVCVPFEREMRARGDLSFGKAIM